MRKEKIKIRLDTKMGKIELESTSDEIKKLLTELEVSSAEDKKITKKKKSSMSDQIIELIRTGFLDERKSFAQIIEKLRLQGYNFPRTSLSPVLLEFIKEGILSRVGERGDYLYYVPKEEAVSGLRADIEYLKKILDVLINIDKTEMGSVEMEKFSSLNDYYLFLTLDALEDKNLAQTVMKNYIELGRISEERSNDFYVGFFLALSEILSLKHKLLFNRFEALGGIKALDRNMWKKRFDDSIKKLGWI